MRRLLCDAACVVRHSCTCLTRTPPSCACLPAPCCTTLQGRYATLGMVQTPGQWRNLAIVFFVAFVALGGNSALNSLKQTRTDRSRARALQELEKEQ